MILAGILRRPQTEDILSPAIPSHLVVEGIWISGLLRLMRMVRAVYIAMEAPVQRILQSGLNLLEQVEMTMGPL